MIFTSTYGPSGTHSGALWQAVIVILSNYNYPLLITTMSGIR